MRKTQLSTVNFTPLIDPIVKKRGIITAAVFGRVWRYCQMETGVCQAPIEKIANDLDLSTRTVIRHLEVLVEDGYLKDHTPNLRNKPHTYSDTWKAGTKVEISAMTESHSAMTESHSGYDTESHPTMTESHMKIDLRKNIREYDEFGLPIEEGEEQQSGLSAEFEKIANITAYDNDKWLEACQNMARNNVTPEILGRAYASLKEKEYTIAGPWSLEKTAIAMAANGNGHPRGEVLQVSNTGRI